MSFIETQNVLIRGTMVGCTGDFKLNVMADAADVVDAINVVYGAVTIQYTTHYFQKSVTANTDILRLVINVPDPFAYLEMLFYADRGAQGYFDNQTIVSRSGTLIDQNGFCLRDILRAGKGQHTLRITAASSGLSNHGFIVCRYIRDTGSSNVG